MKTLLYSALLLSLSFLITTAFYLAYLAMRISFAQ